ncbi:MAG: dTDP-4-dehydrorhamnose reductase [Pyrinomonadaceae bacterium]|nr:dTDP-4-dehydrorhamnose reductase [Pyrinomonadaceae bacterium]
MKVLICGANGLVGRAVVDYCRSLDDEVISLGHSDLDISNRTEVYDTVPEIRPDTLINCAAFTDVDGAESEEEACFAVNKHAVGYLAAACRSLGSTFVTISTDYVFDGEKEGFYTEEDQPNPKSVYGRSKLDGELLAIAENPLSIVVRTGWIFGEGGTNFLCVLGELLKKGNKIEAIEDAYGTPTYAADLARRLRELAEVREPGVFHVTNAGKGTSYFGFAAEAASVLGIEQSLVQKIRSADLSRPAPRPRNSRLACDSAKAIGLPELPHWKESLHKFLTKEKAAS